MRKATQLIVFSFLTPLNFAGYSSGNLCVAGEVRQALASHAYHLSKPARYIRLRSLWVRTRASSE